jgi:hypothetical protein
MPEMKPADYRPVFLDEALEQIFEASPPAQIMRLRIGLLLKIKKSKRIKNKISALFKAAFPSKEYLARFYSVSFSSPKIYAACFTRVALLSAIFLCFSGYSAVINRQ